MFPSPHEVFITKENRLNLMNVQSFRNKKIFKSFFSKIKTKNFEDDLILYDDLKMCIARNVTFLLAIYPNDRKYRILSEGNNINYQMESLQSICNA